MVLTGASATYLFNKNIIIWVVLIFFPFQKSNAQTKLDLNAAYDLLEKQNLDMIQSNLARLLSRQDYRDAKNALLPRLSLGASNNYTYGLVFDQIAGQLITGNTWSNTANANISLQTNIFQGFSRLNNIRLAELNLESENLSLATKKKALKLELLTHFFDALANMEIHKASLQQLELSTNQFHQIKTEFDLGTKTLVDVSLVENQLANDELRILASKNGYDTKLLSIKELLNIPMDDTITLELTNMDMLHYTYDYIFDASPEIALSRLNIRKAELNLQNRRNAYYPTLSLSSGYGTNYSSQRRDYLTGNYMPFIDQVNQNRSLYVGFSLSVPILDGFRVRSEISRAKVSLEQTKNEFEKIRVSQQKLWIAAEQGYRMVSKEYAVYEQQLNSTKTSHEAMNERYNLGMTTAMDLAKSLLDYNLAELNLIRAKYAILYHQELLKTLSQD